ncbi:hypothetical protein [Streptomyces capoamus]|uniref:hypothetical protein n=1 Tax=Streptomyces capoamus TaxID=68183 RepID=UPI0033985FE1
MERKHDRDLAEVVAQAAAGTSQIAVLVGGSSTGKTRACWEVLRLLREQSEPWRLWHPIDPTRPDAALTELSSLAPHTVVWLNEAQEYLAHDQLGEQVAAGLRTLLHDPRRTPVLVLATLWPEHWETLTTRADPDLHCQARELLDGHKIKVPDAFTGADMAALTDTAGRDPRLGEAAAYARDGQVTQYLAGGLLLLDRYEDAPPAARALIHAAMDARRLGAGPRIPLAWLAQAGPGYLTDNEWDETEDDWLEQTLGYVTAPRNGIPGILTSVKTGADRNQRNRPSIRPGAGSARPQPGQQEPAYRLADYLDQHGRHHRADAIPPVDFWTAAAHHAHPNDVGPLGNAAWRRGLYRDAAQLHKLATTHGHGHAAEALVRHLRRLHRADTRPAQWAAAHVALDYPGAVAWLLYVLRKVGAQEQVDALAARAATHVALDDPAVVARLLDRLREVGAQEQVDTLLARNPAPHAALDNPAAVARLLDVLRRVGAQEQLDALAARAAAHAALDDPAAVVELLEALRRVRDREQVDAIAARAAAHVALDDPAAVARLLDVLRRVGAQEQVDALAARAAAHVVLDAPGAVSLLLEALRRVGAQEQMDALLARDPAAHAALDDPAAVARLLYVLREVEAQEQMDALLARDPAAHAALDDPYAVARLLDRLREVGAQEQVDALAARAAAHAALDNPAAVAGLLDVLRRVGTREQVDALAARAATHAVLDDSAAVVRLLKALRKVRGRKQVDTLAARLPAAGQFHQFTEISDHRERFRFGREPDGSAAHPWTWDDLE